MRWKDLSGSSNVEDRRGQGGRGGGFGGGGFRGLPFKGPAGILALIVILVAGYYGVDLTPLLGGGDLSGGSAYTETYTPTQEEQEMARFTSVALKTTEDAWEQIFSQAGATYTPPRLVLYSGVTETTCGYGQAAMGPFYCPDDQTVYIDLSFYQDMKNNLGGGGDFAQGYVVAHEVGHHVQKLLGIEDKVRQMRGRVSQAEGNKLSVMLELQADCFAGVWGHSVQQQGILEAGDLEEALNTAKAIGDDRLQQQSQGRVVPDSFTHGSSEQRYHWFKLGFDTGDPGMCNTFESAQ